jgi:hypothetical protein
VSFRRLVGGGARNVCDASRTGRIAWREACAARAPARCLGGRVCAGLVVPRLAAAVPSVQSVGPAWCRYRGLASARRPVTSSNNTRTALIAGETRRRHGRANHSRSTAPTRKGRARRHERVEQDVGTSRSGSSARQQQQRRTKNEMGRTRRGTEKEQRQSQQPTARGTRAERVICERDTQSLSPAAATYAGEADRERHTNGASWRSWK